MYDKEQIYDEQIYDLMDQIIKVCKKNNIQMLASFGLKDYDETGDDLKCTTYLPSSEYNMKTLEDAYKVIQHGYVVENPYFTSCIITSK